MIVKSQKEIDAFKRVGKVVAATIAEMKLAAKPGMTTKELDELGGRILARYGARSAPKEMYDFPGYTCISINQEAAHGIPGDRVIKPGDVINIDVSAELGGYYADAGHSYQIPPYSQKLVRLCRYTEATMLGVIRNLKAGVKLNEVGRLIQMYAKKGGFKVINNLCSHGIGKSLHEDPHLILPYYDPKEKKVLREGQVITIEPFLSTGADIVTEQPDGWTLMVPDQSFIAQHEHTIIITKKRPIIVTKI